MEECTNYICLCQLSDVYPLLSVNYVKIQSSLGDRLEKMLPCDDIS